MPRTAKPKPVALMDGPVPVERADELRAALAERAEPFREALASARADLEAKRVAARDAADALSDLRDALASGDDGVTPEALALAVAADERARTLLDAATRKAESAERAIPFDGPFVADVLAEIFSDYTEVKHWPVYVDHAVRSTVPADVLKTDSPAVVVVQSKPATRALSSGSVSAERGTFTVQVWGRDAWTRTPSLLPREYVTADQHRVALDGRARLYVDREHRSTVEHEGVTYCRVDYSLAVEVMREAVPVYSEYAVNPERLDQSSRDRMLTLGLSRTLEAAYGIAPDARVEYHECPRVEASGTREVSRKTVERDGAKYLHRTFETTLTARVGERTAERVGLTIHDAIDRAIDGLTGTTHEAGQIKRVTVTERGGKGMAVPQMDTSGYRLMDEQPRFRGSTYVAVAERAVKVETIVEVAK